MAIVNKHHVIEGVNGTDELFELPDSYIEGSLQVLVAMTGGSASYRETSYFPDGFFGMSPAPAAGTNLICFYRYDDGIVAPAQPLDIDGFSIGNIEALMNFLVTQQELIKKMDAALNARLPIDEFNKYSELVQDELTRIKSRIQAITNT